MKKNAEELEKNKNANNSSLLEKREEIEVIEDSILNPNNISSKNNNNINNYSLNNNNNRTNEREHETFGIFNGNNIISENIINSNYSRDEQDNENLQKGKSIQIGYEPENLIDMKRFLSSLNRKIQVDDNKLIYIFREIRLRILRRNNRQLGQLTLYELFMYDLFGTLSKSSYLFHELINNQILNLEVMKILNALAYE